jgi:hypothetical protein
LRRPTRILNRMLLFLFTTITIVCLVVVRQHAVSFAGLAMLKFLTDLWIVQFTANSFNTQLLYSDHSHRCRCEIWRAGQHEMG